MSELTDPRDIKGVYRKYKSAHANNIRLRDLLIAKRVELRAANNKIKILENRIEWLLEQRKTRKYQSDPKFEDIPSIRRRDHTQG